MIALNIVRRSKKIQSSSDLLQYTARYWAELIEEIESEGYKVDSADKHRPSQWITAYKDGNEYEIEVNKYSDGTYEIVKADLVGKIKASCISKKGAVRAADEDSSEWIKLNRKYVLDSDGFYTDYTLYTNGDEYICMFGDEDIYGPDPDYADYETESEQDAWDWFNSYTGFDDEEKDLVLIDNRKSSIVNNDPSLDPGFDEYDICSSEDVEEDANSDDALWDVIDDEEFEFRGVEDVGYDNDGNIMVIFNHDISEDMVELTAEELLAAFGQYAGRGVQQTHRLGEISDKQS